MVLSWSPGGSLVPCEGAAAIDFIFTSTHITVSLSSGLLFWPRLIRTLERYGASFGFHREVKDTAVSKSNPHPSPTVLFDLFWDSLHHLRTGRDADQRNCLQIFFKMLFAVMMSSPSPLAQLCLYLCVCVCLRCVYIIF